MSIENSTIFVQNLSHLDEIASNLSKVFRSISTQHKIKGGHLEFAYLEHYLNELIDISSLFQHLYSNNKTKKFLFVANRMMFEILLKSEYLIQLKNEGSDKKILNLMSKDMASVMVALDDAVGSSDESPAKETLMNVDILNKIFGTGFDLAKVKSNTKSFPDIRSLCNSSKLCLKDYCGEKLWHIYAEFSWRSHSRLGSSFQAEKHFDYEVNYQTEYFIEMYLKNLKLLSTHSKAQDIQEKIVKIILEIRVKFV